MKDRAGMAENLVDEGFLGNGITYVENPIEEDYELIREKYWNKWVAIYQPDHMLTFIRGTVIAYADASDDFNTKWIMQEYMKKHFGRGKVTRFIKENKEECYVIFRNVR